MTEKLIDTIRDQVYKDTLTPWMALALYKRAVKAGDDAARLYLEGLVPDLRGMRFSVVDVSTAASGEVLAAGDWKCLIFYNNGPGAIYLSLDGDTASTTTGIRVAAGGVLEFVNGATNGQINGIADTATSKITIFQG